MPEPIRRSLVLTKAVDHDRGPYYILTVDEEEFKFYSLDVMLIAVREHFKKLKGPTT